MRAIPREVEIEEKRKITNSTAIRLLRTNFSLSAYQKSILIGALLGDGSLSSGDWSKNYRLQIVQGNSQKDYLFWKFDIFRNCCFSEPSYQKWNKSWRFRTISHVVFNFYAKQFYNNKKKVIFRDIIHYLTPLSLAVWFMDDGSIGPRRDGYILNTQSFSYLENKYLQECLSRKFNLDKVSIHKDRKWWRLYIRKMSVNKFYEIINPYIIPSMRYKLHVSDPVETTRRPPMNIGVKI